MKFADITNDIAFRKIFGNEARKEVLISFLNAVLDFEGERRVADVTILNPYQLPQFRDGKATIIDVKARDQSGREFIVEMQVAAVNGFSKRVLYYTAQSYASQIERGEFYAKLNPVVFIGILDFIISQSTSYISRHRVKDVDSGEEIFKDFEFNIIELPKFTKQRHELATLLEKWIFFIKEAENLEVIPENTDDAGLQSAYQAANIQTWQKADWLAYDYASMREQDERGRMEYVVEEAKKATEKAMAQGMAKGIEQGIEKGIAQGIEQGIEKAKQDMAASMKQRGMDISVISELTGLNAEEIQSL